MPRKKPDFSQNQLELIRDRAAKLSTKEEIAELMGCCSESITKFAEEYFNQGFAVAKAEIKNHFYKRIFENDFVLLFAMRTIFGLRERTDVSVTLDGQVTVKPADLPPTETRQQWEERIRLKMQENAQIIEYNNEDE